MNYPFTNQINQVFINFLNLCCAKKYYKYYSKFNNVIFNYLNNYSLMNSKGVEYKEKANLTLNDEFLIK